MAIAHGISLASAAKVKYNNIYGNQPGKPLQVPIGGNVGLLNQSGTAIVATVTAPPHSGRNRSTRTARASHTCGGASHSCRSIGRGVSRARAGVDVLVKPGLYGDLNAAVREPATERSSSKRLIFACPSSRIGPPSRQSTPSATRRGIRSTSAHLSNPASILANSISTKPPRPSTAVMPNSLNSPDSRRRATSTSPRLSPTKAKFRKPGNRETSLSVSKLRKGCRT